MTERELRAKHAKLTKLLATKRKIRDRLLKDANGIQKDIQVLEMRATYTYNQLHAFLELQANYEKT